MTAAQPASMLITGAAQRIGRTLALHFARAGWEIGIHYNTSETEAKSLKSEIEALGSSAVLLPADLSNNEDLARLATQTPEKLKNFTCLINNASLFEDDDLESLTPQTWDKHLNANLKAPTFLAQALANSLNTGTDKAAPGNIINIIDQRVWRLTPRFLSYTVSKAGLWTLTQTLAQALAPSIRVNAIGPGPTLQNIRQEKDDFSRQCQNLLLQRSTNPQEIADAISFMLAAPAMTGQMIALDGGQHLAWETPDVAGIPE
ncbi:MAG: SDR family oxidoreductase [Parvibaculaceae bacterium]|nr:SDR family oxidoreductase [Parvibaculaceae bacterium]